mmetsp:Transcript_38846/g.106992  ORF Transcript_38846/g.106992 Transcript_38846/m.106992 type:complete len:86 (-) Transcript_38846:317-574(-)
MDKLAHKYKGQATFIFCNKDGPGSAAKYVAGKGLPKDGVLKHVDGAGNSQAYQVRYAAHKSIFGKMGALRANNLFDTESELKKVL